jgi:hypothetical protein
MKLAHHGHDIEAVASKCKNGEWSVEVMIEWLEDIVEKEKIPHGIFVSQNDAESWGLLAAVRWIDTGKPDTEAFMTDH